MEPAQESEGSLRTPVDATTPLTHEWFTTAGRTGGKTPLQRFWQSYTDLAKDHGPAPEMAPTMIASGPLAMQSSNCESCLGRFS